ncbi:MAG: NAD(P)/FAD-dependent oxidoreductase [Casimicrobiaceae bacterium]
MTYVVVGSGEAGLHAAVALRSNGYDGALVLVGEERRLPYSRPPLSKSFLTSPDASLPPIRSASELTEMRITMRMGVLVRSIDPVRHVLVCSDGSTLGYVKLILATGSRAKPVQLSGSGSPKIHYLRTFEDADQLRDLLQNGSRVTLIGGGYIGLEIAASATRRGCRVTIIESTKAAMSRVVGPEVSKFVQDLHAEHGVDIRTGEQVREVSAAGGVVEILCASGSRVRADVVVAGVGAEPCTELAEHAKLVVNDGVVVDEFGRTSDADIFACGDVTNHPNRFLGRRLRLESWQHAQQQAATVGAVLAGNPRPYEMVPWFWSDQYDVNLQMIGCPTRWDDVIIKGSVRQKSFTALYLDKGVVVAGNSINRPKDIPPIRSAIEKQIVAPRELLADPTISLAQAFKGATRRTENVA